MYGIWVLLLSYSVVTESCFTYDFETRFEEFTNELRTCVGLGVWISGNYSDLVIDSPHPNSETFITPATAAMSCISSFPFPMNSQGYVEVNIYLDPAVISDQLTVLAFQGIGGDDDPTVGSFSFNAADPSFGDGWYVIRFAVSGATSYDGYISFVGMASADSVLIIDSFRFIPPSVNAEDSICDIYKEDEPTTTTTVTADLDEITTETTPWVTESSTTTEMPSTTTYLDSTTLEPTTITDETTIDISTTGSTINTYPTLNTPPESSPVIEPNRTFWNTFTITMVVLVSLIILCLICFVFYQLGKRKAKKNETPIIFMDQPGVPPSTIMPRVTTNRVNSFSRAYKRMPV